MTYDETRGEVVDAYGTPPAGFTLEAEASRPDAVTGGIVERAIEPDPVDDDLQAAGDSGDADDDDAIDAPDDPAPLEDI
jgi:hypothetical protein